MPVVLCFALKGRLENHVIMGVLTTCRYVACSVGGKPLREHGIADVTDAITVDILASECQDTVMKTVADVEDLVAPPMPARRDLPSTESAVTSAHQADGHSTPGMAEVGVAL